MNGSGRRDLEGIRRERKAHNHTARLRKGRVREGQMADNGHRAADSRQQTASSRHLAMLLLSIRR
jgi:hypothetical protein